MTTSETELAWAAGFFEGEGWIYIPPANQSNGGMQLCVAQSSEDASTPPTLLRFKTAVGGGVIYPQPANALSRKQRWKWILSRRHEALSVVRALTPYMTGDPFVTKVGPLSAKRVHRVL